MFNKISDFIKLRKEINFVLKVEHLFNAKVNLIDVYNYMKSERPITIKDGLKTVEILPNEDTWKKNSFVYIFKSDSVHKKVWLKPGDNNEYDFYIFNFDKAKNYEEGSPYEENYYPICKNVFNGYYYMSSKKSAYKEKCYNVIEIERMMMKNN